MKEIGIRALQQNASATVHRVADGESLDVTERGRPIARLVPIGRTQREMLLASGKLRPALIDRDEYLIRRAGHLARRTEGERNAPEPTIGAGVPSSTAEVLDDLRADRI